MQRPPMCGSVSSTIMRPGAGTTEAAPQRRVSGTQDSWLTSLTEMGSTTWAMKDKLAAPSFQSSLANSGIPSVWNFITTSVKLKIKCRRWLCSVMPLWTNIQFYCNCNPQPIDPQLSADRSIIESIIFYEYVVISKIIFHSNIYIYASILCKLNKFKFYILDIEYFEYILTELKTASIRK